MTKKTFMAFCVVIITLVQLLNFQFYSNASSYGFKTVDLSKSQIEKIWENINLQKCDNYDIQNDSLPIMSFDVSTSENVVLGLQNNRILILNKNNDVLDCFEFTNDGTFYVKWYNENILLFMSRGTIILEFSLNGELVNMIKTDTQSVANNKQWNDVIHNTAVSINGYNYNLQNDLGILNIFTFRSFSQLVKSDESGNITVIYDVNQNQLVKIISTIVMLSLFACICLFMARNRLIEVKEQGVHRGRFSVFDD